MDWKSGSELQGGFKIKNDVGVSIGFYGFPFWEVLDSAVAKRLCNAERILCI